MLSKQVSDFIVRHQLLSREGLHLVALSGGADSVALLHLLITQGYRVEAVHCNFQLRGEESNRDERFAEALSNRLKVPFHRIHFDTRTYAELHHVSIEMAARNLRYDYFEQLANDIGAETICVAHHRDDAVETFLMNLMRGSGIHGLTGIRPRNGKVVRPLLPISRNDIETYLKQLGEPYITDSTNLETDVLRNKIRLQLIPLLKTLQPKAVENIDQTATYLAEIEQLFTEQTAQQQAHLLRENGTRLNIADLRTISFPENFLHEWLSPLGFNSTQTIQLFRRLDKEEGVMFESNTHQLLADRGYLIVEPIHQPLPTIRIPETGLYVYQENILFLFEKSNDITISKSDNIATFDAEKVEFPLTIRPIKEGDRFVPFGMNGHQLLSDFLTNRKLTRFEKRRQLVITDRNGDIIWAVGCRTDNRFKVSKETTSVCRIKFQQRSCEE